MKLDGFRLYGIYLEADGERFDLHNCFDFVGLDYEVSSRTLRLRWAPCAYSPPAEHHSITITFHQVSHFSAVPRDPEMPFTEDDCLAGIYYPIPDTDLLAYIEPDTVPPADAPYVFRFMSGFSLRVHGEGAQYQLL